MGYTTEQYLLDRAHIHDTVTKIYWAFDSNQLDKLSTEVFADKIIVDYTSLFGGEPREHRGEGLQGEWIGLKSKVGATQHIITGVLAFLPPPSTDAKPPSHADVTANVTAYLSRTRKSDGKLLETRNGGRLDLELARTAPSGQTQNFSGNAWRISKFKANMAWKKDDEGFWNFED